MKQFLDPTPVPATDQIEVLRSGWQPRDAQVALFDFDGTLSLIRSGWVDVMVPMMVECLLECHSGESEEELTAVVREYVDRLTGKQTIYQMIELARQIELRGGKPLDSLVYKRRYLDRLHQRIHHRLDALRSGKAAPDDYLVPGSRELLEALRERGLSMYLASGTDQPLVDDEVRLLQIDHYFDGGVHGARDDYKSFSKRILIQGLLAQPALRSATILGFGDGYVEIQDVKEANGIAVGVATDEPECRSVNQWKRNRLAGVGADVIIANFQCHAALLSLVFPQ